MVEAMKYMRHIGIDNIYRHDMKLDSILREEMASFKGLEMISIEDHGPIITFRVEGKDSSVIKRNLQQLDRPVELSVRNGLIRVSPHLYNTETDVIEFIEGLKQAL
jgi:selenocysteine lyase/cysteine desulfurase